MPGLVRAPSGLLWPVLGGLVLMAWLVLARLEQSPYDTLVHGHHGVPGDGALDARWASGFLLGWLLMTVAMMLPTTAPLVALFNRMVAPQRDAFALTLLLLGGYVAAWLGFGTAALVLVWVIGQLLSGWSLPGWILAASLFVIAGAFQFSTLKYACLDKCRTPLGFLSSHWHGRSRRAESFEIGWRHGIFCVGCCWALMMLMFAFGTASLGWMLLLALLMAVEKNFPWGQHLAHPLGVALLAAGAGTGIYNLTP